jgi:hypothetical protein
VAACRGRWWRGAEAATVAAMTDGAAEMVATAVEAMASETMVAKYAAAAEEEEEASITMGVVAAGVWDGVHDHARRWWWWLLRW